MYDKWQFESHWMGSSLFKNPHSTPKFNNLSNLFRHSQFISFSIIVTRLTFNPYHTINKVTWNLTDKWGYYWWAGDHCPLWARTWCCGHRLLTTERCPRWPMCRVTPGLPRPLGPAPAPGSVMTQHWRHETLICHPHTSMWRLIYAIMPCPLTEK